MGLPAGDIPSPIYAAGHGPLSELQMADDRQTVRARSGRLALQVRPVKLANKAVMDLRTVRWVPVGVDDDSESNAR